MYYITLFLGHVDCDVFAAWSVCCISGKCIELDGMMTYSDISSEYFRMIPSLTCASLQALVDSRRLTFSNTMSGRRQSSFTGETNCRLSRDLLTSRDLIPEVEHDAYSRLSSSRCDGRPPGPGPAGPPAAGELVNPPPSIGTPIRHSLRLDEIIRRG